MDALHSQVAQFTAGRRIYGRKLRGCIWPCSLSLLSSNASGWLWWRFVLGLVLLFVLLYQLSAKVSRIIA